MSFHESFWVVVGTAAPVVAVAAVISVSEISRAQATVNKASVRALVVARQDKTDTINRLLNMRERGLVALCVTQLLNLCLQAGLLAVSLLSLAFQRNLIPVWICVIAPTAGVLLLAYAGMYVTRAQVLTRSNEEMLKTLQGGQQAAENLGTG
jgi:hypothetical protein